MAVVKIEQFHGIAPRIHPSLLGEGMAVTAHNVKLKNGKLVPLRQPEVMRGIPVFMENGLKEIAKSQSLHAWKRYDGSIEFLAFPGVTWMADGNLADDESTRVIVSGDTGFGDSKTEPVLYMRRKGYGGRILHDIVKKPLNVPPKVSRVENVTNPLDDANKRYTYFFWTWVDEYGYESPTSDPSNEIEYNDGDTISFSTDGLEIPKDATTIRVYKVITGTSEGRIQFIKDITVSGATIGGFSVKVKDEDAGEIQPDIVAMPSDLKCVIKVPGNYYAGFSPSRPKTVMFSAVDLLYSWPDDYRYDVDDNIVALAATSNTVFALTDGWPFVLSGTGPDTMTVSKLAGPASCVSPRSVCVFRNAVYYASNQGLMTIYNSADAGTVCANLTDKIFTKDQWLALRPSTCVAGQFDGALHLFFDNDGPIRGLSIDLTEQADAVTTHDEVAACLCVDNKTDRMYFVRKGGVR